MTADLVGRTYVITGANTGVGRATAEALAARGARLLLACRSLERAREVEGAARALGGEVHLVELDLADLASVRRGAQSIARLTPRIDALINNAGVAGARGLTKDGFELAFGVNCLGHFLLTQLLRPHVQRVVHLGSGSHARVEALELDSLRAPTRTLTGVREYAVSKLCVMLLHHELARRSTTPISVVADPGDVASDAWRHVPWPIRPLLTRSMKPPREGALTSLFCATDPTIEGLHGCSFVDCREDTPSALSRDAALAAALWARCADWTAATMIGAVTGAAVPTPAPPPRAASS